MINTLKAENCKKDTEVRNLKELITNQQTELDNLKA